jgi:hypothetical protein
MSVIERERRVKIQSPRTMADDLNYAADLLESEEWGWCQGVARNGDSLCMLGALAVATGNALREHQESFEGDLGPRYEAAYKVLPEGKAAWNDEPGRTKAEVISALRSAAERSQ